MKYIFFISMVVFISCTKKQTIIFNAGKDTCQIVKLQEKSNSDVSFEIMSNSLSDSFKIGEKIMPLKKTGHFMVIRDYYLDTIRICFKSYKAKSGSIKLKIY